MWRQLVRSPNLLGLPFSICFMQYINAASAAAAPDAKKKRVSQGAPVSGRGGLIFEWWLARVDQHK
jgi:hypothetical protein